MKKNWHLFLNDEIWVEFWDEIPNSTLSIKFGINKHHELLNNEIRVLPLQPRPDTNITYLRSPGTDVLKSNDTQLKTIDIRKINLAKLRQRSLNIIFDYQDLNPEEFNIKTNNLFRYPLTNKQASKELIKMRHKKNTEEHLALISLLYIGQLHRGNNYPYQELHLMTAYSIFYLKNMIKSARKEGYLTSPVHKGISGGALSKKGYKILVNYLSSI